MFATWFAALDDANAPILDFQLPMAQPLNNVTVREVAHISIGGDTIRIRLSNLFGTAPIVFSKVHIAKSLTAASIDPSTDKQVTFHGVASVSVDAKTEIWSDEIELPVESRDDLAISLFVSGSADIATEHRYAQRNNYVALGDATSAVEMTPFTQTITSSYWLGEIDVSRSTPTDVVVAFGDSITDGNNSSSGANLRYPDQLSKLELGSAVPGPQLSVVNAGIGGNRWLHDGLGHAGSMRYAHDALDVPGVSDVVILMGINDIGFGVFSMSEAVTAAELQAAITDAIQRARSAGLRVFIGTLLPFGGSLYYTADGETTRKALNAWILANTDVDGVFDFDRLLRDSTNATTYDARYDSGDHLHPNDFGYSVMANAVHLAKLR